MLDEYWLDRKLTDNDLHILRMKFHDHAHETLELPLNSDTSFCRCPSLGGSSNWMPITIDCYAAQTKFLIVEWVRVLAPTKPALVDMASINLRIG